MSRLKILSFTFVFFFALGLVFGARSTVDSARPAMTQVQPPKDPRPVPQDIPEGECLGEVYALALAIAAASNISPPCEVAWHVLQAGRRHGIDPYLLAALGHRESTWRLNVRGRKGEVGPLQVMPATARELGVYDLSDWRQTLDAGAAYLAKMMKRAGGDTRVALAYYNAGPGRGRARALRVSGRYADQVLATWRQIKR